MVQPNSAWRIRAYRPTDAAALREVFHSAVHHNATEQYSAEQRAAWAPDDYDDASWQAMLDRLRPWVLEDDSGALGYADLQPDGYIDHLFVRGGTSRRGIGSALLGHVLALARARGLAESYAHVSLSAQPLFRRFGFVVEQQREVVQRGVTMVNALMRCRLTG